MTDHARLSLAAVQPIGTVAADRSGSRRVQAAVLHLDGVRVVRLATHVPGRDGIGAHVSTIRLGRGHLATLLLTLDRAARSAWGDEWHLPDFSATRPSDGRPASVPGAEATPIEKPAARILAPRRTNKPRYVAGAPERRNRFASPPRESHTDARHAWRRQHISSDDNGLEQR